MAITLEKEYIDLAKCSDAYEIAEMFTAALGKDGIGAPGCEPYPEPALFSAEGIKSIIDNLDRRLVIAKIDGKIAGGIVADYLSPYQCEFNCMAVRKDMRGKHIGTKIIAGAKKIIEEDMFTMNTTELVTHSMLSQSAHFSEGYNRITGFAFCHYPNVFFANHPESVLWVSKPQGKLVAKLQNIRKELGNAINFESPNWENICKKELPIGEYALAKEILKQRDIFVPEEYRQLVKDILHQFQEIFDYQVISSTTDTKDSISNDSVPNIDWKDGYGHTYITYNPNFNLNIAELDSAVKSVKKAGKRFILVRIPANNPHAIETANLLRSEGFVFHSIAPLYGFDKYADGSHMLYDILTLQWIAPDIIQSNPLPGQTNSVIHLYGYPLNLSGKIIKLIKKETRQCT
jgi:hypothetical protein